MSYETIFHKDLTGADLHEPKPHANSHETGGSDPIPELADGDININEVNAFYLGDKNTDGTWRIIRSGNNLVFQRREGGTWVEKGSMLP